MNVNDIHKAYFIGIGGIGMSALARYFHTRGVEVSGYDRVETPLTKQLQEEGIAIHFEDNLVLVPKDADLVVYTPAVPVGHSELQYYQQEKYPVLKRSEVLGLITKDTHTVAVAGTHGKTTTSSIIAHIFRYADVDSTAFLGGITRNYNSNLLLSETSKITVVEADEFDRSFLTLHPNIAIVTSMDPDHLDIYGTAEYMFESFALFAKQVENGGTLIYKKGLPFQEEKHVKTCTYAIEEVADYYAQNITIENGEYHFDIVTNTGSIERLTLGLPGRHNVENAIAAVAAAREYGIDTEAIRGALESFQGVKRRFEYIIREDDLVFIDDYAHHPEELNACINSVKEMFPGKKVTGIFQPHLYSRTRDFEDDFARSLELLDEVVLLDIYPARELPIEGITSENLLKKVRVDQKTLIEKNALVENMADRKLEVLLTLGAGDIDQLVAPLKEKLLQDRA